MLCSIYKAMASCMTSNTAAQEKYSKLSSHHDSVMSDYNSLTENLTKALDGASELDARMLRVSQDKDATAAALTELAEEHSILNKDKQAAQEAIAKLEEQVGI